MDSCGKWYGYPGQIDEIRTQEFKRLEGNKQLLDEVEHDIKDYQNRGLHTYIHSLFDNAGYKVRKTKVLVWTCLPVLSVEAFGFGR